MALRHQVVWEKCAFTHPKTDKETILNRGELLPEWVSDFTVQALTGAGAIRAVEQLDPPPTSPAPDPEHQLPPVVTADGGVQLPPPSPVTLAKPAAGASKPDWVAYAVSQRAEDVSEESARAEADAMSRATLAAKYGNGS